MKRASLAEQYRELERLRRRFNRLVVLYAVLSILGSLLAFVVLPWVWS